MDKIVATLLIMFALLVACTEGNTLEPEEEATKDSLSNHPCAGSLSSEPCILQLQIDSLVYAQANLRDSLKNLGWIPFFGFECKRSPFIGVDSILGKRAAVLIPPDARSQEECLSFVGSEFYWKNITEGYYGKNPCVDHSFNCDQEKIIDLQNTNPIFYEGDTLAFINLKTHDLGFAYQFRFFSRPVILEGEDYNFHFLISTFDEAYDYAFATTYSFYLYDDPI